MLYIDPEIPPPTVSGTSFEKNCAAGLFAFYASLLATIFEEAPTSYPANWHSPPFKPSLNIYIPSIFYPFTYFFPALDPAYARPVPIEETEVWTILDFTKFKAGLKAFAATAEPNDENPNVEAPSKIPKPKSVKKS